MDEGIELGEYSDEWVGLFEQYTTGVTDQDIRNFDGNTGQENSWYRMFREEIREFKSIKRIMREGHILVEKLRKIKTQEEIEEFCEEATLYEHFVDSCMGEEQGLTIDLFEVMLRREYEKQLRIFYGLDRGF